MNRKIVGIMVAMLMVVAGVLPMVGQIDAKKNNRNLGNKISLLGYDNPDLCIPSRENLTYICATGDPAVEADPPGGAWEDAYFDELDCCGTEAQWIWYNTGGNPDPDECKWFCNDFEIDCDVQKAELVYTADDAIKVQLNGDNEILSDSGGVWFWKYLHSYTFNSAELDLFVQGTNTLSVQICDEHGNYAGGIWCLKIWCETEDSCVDLTKKVWDPTAGYNGGAWVDEMDACVGDNITFKLEICNCGTCGLSHFIVEDVLPGFLTYNIGSSTIAGQPFEPTISGNVLEWTFVVDPALPTAECFDVIFETHVDSPGADRNCATVTAYCGEQGDSDYATDCATVYVYDCTCLDVEKQVSLDKEYWQEEVDAGVGDHVFFKITVHNNCSETIEYIHVTDNLPACLEYVNANPSPVTTYPSIEWSFDSETLDHCESKEIWLEAEVTDVDDEINVNSVTAMAIGKETGLKFSNSDTAIVNKKGCCLNITRFEGGSIGSIVASFENTGLSPCHNITWEFTFDVGLILSGSASGSITNLDPGADVDVTSGFVLGFGSGTATFVVDAQNNDCGPIEITKDIFILGPMFFIQ